MPIRSAVLLLALCFAPLATAAETKSASEYLGDARDYALSPLHWDQTDWEWAAGAAAGIAAAYSVDQRVRAHFADPSGSQMGDPHSLRDAVPTLALTLGTLGIGALRHDERTERTGWDMAEAIVLGSASSFVLKHAIGRERPDATDDRSSFGHGGDSFPSGHTTAAFAAAQVFADSRPQGEWQWRALAYSLAVATAYARVKDNMHWTSDVVAGAALGIATGRFVSARGDESHRSRVSVSVTPIEKGAFISFTFVPH
jgi:hypothetical protein